MATIPAWLAGALGTRLARMRFPKLFLLLTGLFVLDVLIPDMVPFLDEILLGAASVLVGNLTRRRDGGETRGSGD